MRYRNLMLLLLVCCLTLGFTVGMLTMFARDVHRDRRLPDPEPTPVPQSDPCERFLRDVEGTAILFCTASNCAPCAMAKRDLVPWLTSHRWPVREVSEPDNLDALGVTSFPTFIAVRDHRDVGRCTGYDRQQVADLLQAARGDGFSHLGVAVAAHVLNHGGRGAAPIGSPAPAAGKDQPVGMPAPRVERPLLAFPFGPSVSFLDFLKRYEGQSYTFGIAQVSVPRGVSWKATRHDHAVRLALHPRPTIGFTRYLRDLISLSAVEIEIDRAVLVLDGFPDLPVRFTW